MKNFLLRVLRIYVRLFPIASGKTFVVRRLIHPLLRRSESSLLHEVVPGQTIELSCHEDVGLGVWLYGSFEKEEIACISQYIGEGDVVCDIGANVGLFTLAMASSVGRRGRVWSFEPLQVNLHRLQKNVERNSLQNIDIYPIALGDYDGDAHLTKELDGAYGHLKQIAQKDANSRPVIQVPIKTLDSVWIANSRPEVTFIKIDVEGAEGMVIDGASECLNECRPILILEANSEDELSNLETKLAGFGYVANQPNGFRQWNWLFRSE